MLDSTSGHAVHIVLRQSFWGDNRGRSWGVSDFGLVLRGLRKRQQSPRASLSGSFIHGR